MHGLGGLRQGGGQHRDEGAGLPQQQRVIKSSQCQWEPEPHSPAEPSGRMKRGFHGYHAKEENIWIKLESKVPPLSFHQSLDCGQGLGQASWGAGQLHPAGPCKEGREKQQRGQGPGAVASQPLPPLCPGQAGGKAG